MKRSLFANIKGATLAVSASAMMLGAAQAGTTVGVNFLASYYGGNLTAPITTTAFGIDVADWYSSPVDPANGSYTVFTSSGSTFGLSLSRAWTDISWAYAGAQPVGTMPNYVGYPDDACVYHGNISGPYSVGLSGLATQFPNGYVVQPIAAGNYATTMTNITVNDGATTNTLIYTHRGKFDYGWGISGSYGIYSSTTTPFTSDTLTINGPDYNYYGPVWCWLSGFIITDKPVVSVPPAGGTYNSGDTISMTAGAVGLSNGLHYQWRLNGSPIPGANSPTYTKPGASTVDTGNYDLVVTNLYGSATSAVASVTVIAAPTFITDVPGATNTVYAGFSASFSVVVGGASPFAYQWNKDGSPISGATNATLILTNLTTGNSGGYSVTVTNIFGSASSSTNQLTVLAPTDPLYVAQVALNKPLAYWPLNELAPEVNTFDYAGGGHNGVQAGTMTIGVDGPKPPDFIGFDSTNTAYQFDGASTEVLTSGLNLNTNTITITVWIKRNGDQPDWCGLVTTTRSVPFSGLHFGDNNELRYSWSDHGWDQNSGLVVPDGQWVLAALVIEPNKATIRMYPGGSFVHTVTQQNISWANGLVMGHDKNSGSRRFNGAMSEVALYSRALSEAELQNLYYAGKYGSATEVPPAIVENPASKTAYATLGTKFTVLAEGASPLSYTWIKNSSTVIEGATTETLTLTNLLISDSGSTYQVIVSNSLGSVTSSVATLTVVAPPFESFVYADGVIDGTQNGGSGWAGAWAQVGTAGSHSVTNPGSIWRDANNELTVAGGTLAIAGGSGGIYDGRDLAATVGGVGTVYVSFIGQFNGSGWGGIDLMEGSSVRCFLGGGWWDMPWGVGSFPYPGIVSSKSSELLSFVVCRFDYTPTNTQVRLYVNPTLASEPAVADATGTLGLFQFNRVVVKAAYQPNPGFIDELRIAGTWAAAVPSTPRTDPPVIVKDLAGSTVYAYPGSSASMSIVADGAPALHYLWKKNGTTPVGTDSSTLSLSSLAPADTGDYSVTVTNAYGTTNSLVNHLTVVALPDLLTTHVMADGPVAYWPLSESTPATAYDYSGNFKNGTQTNGLTLGVDGPRPPGNAGFAASKKAYQFDGATGYIALGTMASLSGSTDFTVEAWINTTNANGRLIQQRDNTGNGYNGQYQLSVAGGAVSFMVYNGGYQFGFSTSKTINDGKWHHVAAVRSGTNGVIYIDGSVAATASGPIKDLNPALNSYIGADMRDSVNYYNGLMCDVAIYNTALSSARIADHAYTGIMGTAPIVLSTVPGGFIEDSKTVGTAHHGLNKGSTWVASSGPDVNGKTRAGVAQFAAAGSTQIVVPADADFNSTVGTISFWVKADALPSGSGSEAAILMDRRTSSGVVITLKDDATLWLQFNGGNAAVTAPAYLPDGNWHHVAVTYDQSVSGSTTVYIDGVSTVSQANTAAWSWPAAQQIELGKSHDTWWKRFDGQMDEFRIYNRILDSTEVAALYSSDAVVDATALKVRYNFGTALGVGTSLTWPIGALESTPSLSPSSWAPVSGAVSPYPWMQPPPNQPTNAAAFYRVKL